MPSKTKASNFLKEWSPRFDYLPTRARQSTLCKVTSSSTPVCTGRMFSFGDVSPVSVKVRLPPRTDYSLIFSTSITLIYPDLPAHDADRRLA